VSATNVRMIQTLKGKEQEHSDTSHGEDCQ